MHRQRATALGDHAHLPNQWMAGAINGAIPHEARQRGNGSPGPGEGSRLPFLTSTAHEDLTRRCRGVSVRQTV